VDGVDTGKVAAANNTVVYKQSEEQSCVANANVYTWISLARSEIVLYKKAMEPPVLYS